MRLLNKSSVNQSFIARKCKIKQDSLKRQSFQNISRTTSKNESNLLDANNSGVVTNLQSDDENFLENARKIDFSAEID